MAATMNFSKMKLNDLKKELKDRGLTVSGNKSELIARLKEHMEINETADNYNDDILTDTSNSSTIGEPNEPDLELGGDDDLEENVDDEILKDDEALPLDTGNPPDTLLDDKLEDALGIGTTTVETILDDKESKKEPASVLHGEDQVSPDKDHGDAKVKSLKATLTASERLAIRAKKFGVVSEDVKKKTREERFGSTGSTSSEAVSSTTEAVPIGTSVKPTDIKRLKERAERFGSSVSPSMSKLEDSERQKERLKRFGALTASSVSAAATSSEMDEKRKRRAERFGKITSTSSGGANGNVDEKKRKREERFGSSV
ncbi:SAP domain-containing ribonucleoprotein-like isoform X3 [Lineus longissimus]|uniref:SAP domain-containing ribonucleoprotein-like isoform X3 n=1 Tax=Lineus longissimus TaxID=88925 RepID=UPI00315C6D23